MKIPDSIFFFFFFFFFLFHFFLYSFSIRKNMGPCGRLRSYPCENTRSHPNSEVKHMWAGFVEWWVTTFESLVLKTTLFFFSLFLFLSFFFVCFSQVSNKNDFPSIIFSFLPPFPLLPLKYRNHLFPLHRVSSFSSFSFSFSFSLEKRTRHINNFFATVSSASVFLGL